MQALLKAIRFAAEKHRHQRRVDVRSSPYINHPIAVADLLANEVGIENTTILTAAILHDTIEDTDTTEREIKSKFGLEVARVVMELTDDMRLAPEVRKQAQIEHASQLSYAARLVKIADKTCKLRDLAENPPLTWSAERCAQYRDQAAAVVEQMRGTHPELQRLFERALTRCRENLQETT